MLRYLPGIGEDERTLVEATKMMFMGVCVMTRIPTRYRSLDLQQSRDAAGMAASSSDVERSGAPRQIMGEHAGQRWNIKGGA